MEEVDHTSNYSNDPQDQAEPYIGQNDDNSIDDLDRNNDKDTRSAQDHQSFVLALRKTISQSKVTSNAYLILYLSLFFSDLIWRCSERLLVIPVSIHVRTQSASPVVQLQR